MLIQDSQDRLRPSVPRSYDDLDAVRSLLIGPEQQKLEEIESALQRPTSASALASVLPKSVQLSLSRDPRALAEALFPVIGPAIQRAIRSALREMVASLNLVVERSLSVRAWGWRLEAWRSGRSFAEVALTHSVVYQVEQVFLIHRPSGILLAEVGGVQVAEADTVSAMLTAITDFVKDSFAKQESGSLEELQVGHYTIVIEEQQRLLIAAVVRGIAPSAQIREAQREALAAIRSVHASDLEHFRGNSDLFEDTRPHLERCLLSQYAGRPLGQSRLGGRLLLAVMVILLAVISAVVGKQVVRSARVTRFADRLRSEPGIVVVSAEVRRGKHVITGLRDPLAVDPSALLRESALPNGEVEFAWAAYQSMDSRFILRRLQTLLRPPSSISLGLTDGVVRITGSASHRWIEDAKRLAPSLGGVDQVMVDQVIDQDRQTFIRSGNVLSSLLIHFEKGLSVVLPEDEAALKQVVTVSKDLLGAARVLDLDAQVVVVGHADALGSAEENLVLSRQRANVVLLSILKSGLSGRDFVAEGVGEVWSQETNEEPDKRSVSFWVRTRSDQNTLSQSSSSVK